MTKRLFFALWPSEHQRQLIEAAVEPHRSGLSARWVSRDNWHVTLVFIGAFAEKYIAALQIATGDIRPAAIRLRFDRIDYWPRPKVMCLQTDRAPNELVGLVATLERAAGVFGFRPEKRGYRPHMTIARQVRSFESMPLARPLELEWRDFRLMESVSSPAGVQYRPLKQ